MAGSRHYVFFSPRKQQPPKVQEGQRLCIQRSFAIEHELYEGLTELAQLHRRTINGELNAAIAHWLLFHAEARPQGSPKAASQDRFVE